MFKWLFGEKSIQEVLQRDPQATETMIWQHPSTEFNTNSRINLGLNEVAVFYDMYKGEKLIIDKSQDLKTGNIPLLGRLTTKVTGGVSKYQCRVYFIRTSSSTNLPWATPNALGPYEDKIRKGLFYSLYMNGIYSFRIVDIEKFLRLVDSDRAIDFRTFETERVFDNLIAYIQRKIDCLLTAIGADYIFSKNIILNTSDALAEDLQTDVLDELGIKLEHFKIREVNLPNDKDDPYVKALASLTDEGVKLASLDMLGLQKYLITHGVSIGEIAAANNGAAGAAAGIGIGAGVGAGIGGQLGNMIQNTFGGVVPSNAMGISPNATVGGNPMGASPSLNPQMNSAPISFELSTRLERLKQLYNQNIISKEQYDSSVAEILRNI